MKRNLFPILTLVLIVFFSACNKDNEDIVDPNAKYSNGAFISNEGAFGVGNSSVSFLDFETDIVTNEIFMGANARPMGDVLQSMSLISGNMYCIVNASNKIEVVKANEFTELGVIEGLDNPRSLTASNGKLYVTEWGNGGQVKVFDAASFVARGSIEVGTGPEGILNHHSLLWVANGGGFALDSTVTVIDPVSEQILITINVGHNPKEMVVDANDDVWVICNGYTEYDASWNIARQTPSKLVKISVIDLEVANEYIISETSHPNHIDISKDRKTIYYGGGYGVNGISSVNYVNNSITETIAADKSFYGFNVNRQNGDIYGLEVPSFTENGNLIKYNSTGTVIKQYEVGIGPNSVVFL
jgi:hypothetical protein